jgi:hypothetical protein
MEKSCMLWGLWKKLVSCGGYGKKVVSCGDYGKKSCKLWGLWKKSLTGSVTSKSTSLWYYFEVRHPHYVLNHSM